MAMEIIFSSMVVIITFWFMEFMAWFMHKFVMHGFLWNLHFDHHNTQPGFFQKNDTFFLIFAIPSWLFIMFGMIYQINYLTAVGLGILLYGIAYFLVHEVLIHNRFKKLRKLLFEKLNNDYLNTLIYAHKMHHKHIGKEYGESFGMLIVDKKYYTEFETKKIKKSKL